MATGKRVFAKKWKKQLYNKLIMYEYMKNTFQRTWYSKVHMYTMFPALNVHGIRNELTKYKKL